eukprot:TRINITY_DN7491_c0_g1_i1.p1 TRINITY_DN7491_c0_g1~~TRINITY_DN7491_c0_g1_i1.p1  ORF type:complete len:1548 (+),score=439.67 TRINITY_DN7491_c0_g1_i1:85-4728(+)
MECPSPARDHLGLAADAGAAALLQGGGDERLFLSARCRYVAPGSPDLAEGVVAICDQHVWLGPSAGALEAVAEASDVLELTTWQGREWVRAELADGDVLVAPEAPSGTREWCDAFLDAWPIGDAVKHDADEELLSDFARDAELTPDICEALGLGRSAGAAAGGECPVAALERERQQRLAQHQAEQEEADRERERQRAEMRQRVEDDRAAAMAAHKAAMRRLSVKRRTASVVRRALRQCDGRPEWWLGDWDPAVDPFSMDEGRLEELREAAECWRAAQCSSSGTPDPPPPQGAADGAAVPTPPQPTAPDPAVCPGAGATAEPAAAEPAAADAATAPTPPPSSAPAAEDPPAPATLIDRHSPEWDFLGVAADAAAVGLLREGGDERLFLSARCRYVAPGSPHLHAGLVVLGDQHIWLGPSPGALAPAAEASDVLELTAWADRGWARAELPDGDILVSPEAPCRVADWCAAFLEAWPIGDAAAGDEEALRELAADRQLGGAACEALGLPRDAGAGGAECPVAALERERLRRLAEEKAQLEEQERQRLRERAAQQQRRAEDREEAAEAHKAAMRRLSMKRRNASFVRRRMRAAPSSSQPPEWWDGDWDPAADPFMMDEERLGCMRERIEALGDTGIDLRQPSMRSSAAGRPLPDDRQRQVSLRSGAAATPLPAADLRQPSMRSSAAGQPLPQDQAEPPPPETAATGAAAAAAPAPASDHAPKPASPPPPSQKPPPRSYMCRHCKARGAHWATDCPLTGGSGPAAAPPVPGASGSPNSAMDEMRRAAAERKRQEEEELQKRIALLARGGRRRGPAIGHSRPPADPKTCWNDWDVIVTRSPDGSPTAESPTARDFTSRGSSAAEEEVSPDASPAAVAPAEEPAAEEQPQPATPTEQEDPQPAAPAEQEQPEATGAGAAERPDAPDAQGPAAGGGPAEQPPAAAEGGVRGWLEGVLREHNPEKLGNVDLILQKYAGREEELRAAISAKYGVDQQDAGPAQSRAAAPPPPAAEADSMRLWVEAFFQRHNPERLAHVDKILEKYAGRDAELKEALCTKYGVSAAEADMYAAPPPAVEARRSSVSRATSVPSGDSEPRGATTEASSVVLVPVQSEGGSFSTAAATWMRPSLSPEQQQQLSEAVTAAQSRRSSVATVPPDSGPREPAPQPQSRRSSVAAAAAAAGCSPQPPAAAAAAEPAPQLQPQPQSRRSSVAAAPPRAEPPESLSRQLSAAGAAQERSRRSSVATAPPVPHADAPPEQEPGQLREEHPARRTPSERAPTAPQVAPAPEQPQAQPQEQPAPRQAERSPSATSVRPAAAPSGAAGGESQQRQESSVAVAAQAAALRGVERDEAAGRAALEADWGSGAAARLRFRDSCTQGRQSPQPTARAAEKSPAEQLLLRRVADREAEALRRGDAQEARRLQLVLQALRGPAEQRSPERAAARGAGSPSPVRSGAAQRLAERAAAAWLQQLRNAERAGDCTMRRQVAEQATEWLGRLARHGAGAGACERDLRHAIASVGETEVRRAAERGRMRLDAWRQRRRQQRDHSPSLVPAG